LNKKELKDFLETKYLQYNQPDFISTDPVSIPHQFTKKEDIEISGFLAATIAWGQRITILNNSKKLLSMMDNSPHDFILNFKEEDLKPFEKFYHRTFNGHDAKFFLTSLQDMYRYQGGLERSFKVRKKETNVKEGIIHARKVFFMPDHFNRTEKHFSDPKQKSAANASTCSSDGW
jgi:uncharacterized protein (TIGR02757 family)